MKNTFLFIVGLLSIVFITKIAQSQITVSGSTGADGDYTTLTVSGGAFDLINSSVQTGNNIVITITADATAETGTISLNEGAWATLTINPTGGVARTISGTPTAGNPLINLNGADNVTIDGLNTGGNSLIISNLRVAATSGTSTIRFINGATNNTITNCDVRGSGTMSVATNGGIIFFSTDGTTANGNDNNTISNCNIGPAGSNLPTKGIYGNGSTTTTAKGNSGIVINNNNIFDYFGAAVTSSGVATADGCNNWTVTNNRFYQTGSRTWTTGAVHSAIQLNTSTSTSGMQGAVITGNTIGYASNTQTGTYTLTGSTGKFLGIQVTAIASGIQNRISNNTIASVSLTGVTSSGSSNSSPFVCILATTGPINVDSNTIGSQSATGSLTFTTNTSSLSEVYSIFNNSADNWYARNNNIGGITINNAGSGDFYFYGIRANMGGSGATFNASNNIIGGTVANSISNNSTGSFAQMKGMSSSFAYCTWTSNIIRNLTAAGGTSTGTSSSINGMEMRTTTENHTLSSNIIHTLTNTSAAGAVTIAGIYFTSTTGTNIVEKNFIHSFSLVTSSAAAVMNGISVNSGTVTYKNNKIRLGVDASGNSVTAGVIINGISEQATSINNFYNNSVYIGGTNVVSTAANTYAFISTITSSARNFRNNIFWNARSNSTSTGKHYAVRVGGTAPNPTGLTIDYNAYYVSGTGGTFGFFNSLDVANLAAWRTAVGQDGASISGYDPQFITPNGTSSTVDLHIHASNPTVIEGAGIPIAGVTDDYDGQTRSGLTPTDIGADAGNFVVQDVSAPTISYTPLGKTTVGANQTLTATITDASGVGSGLGIPTLYWKLNTGSYNAVTGVDIGSNQYTFTFGSATTIAGDVISYYIAAQDIAGTPNVGTSPSGGASGFATNPPSAATPPTPPSSFTAAASYSGIINVGPGETYTTLTNAGGAFASINVGVLTGNTTLLITGNISGELGTNALLQWTEVGGSGYTLTIKPQNASTTISGDKDLVTGLIYLNGADRVTIDGSISGGTDKNLTISNTNTSGSVIGLQNNATNNTIKNCILQGVAISLTRAVLYIGTTASGTEGNSNNIINNNDITKGSTSPANCIYNFGNITAKNTNNIFSSNRISDFSSKGIFDGGSSASCIYTGNEIYQNANQSNDLIGFNPNSPTIDGFTFTRNHIHDLKTTSTGFIYGIHLTDISAIDTGRIINNVISLSETAPLTVYGIYDQSVINKKYQIYYNSVYLGGSVTGSSNSRTYNWANASLSVVKNNIFTNARTGGTGKHYAIAFNTSYSSINCDYNNIYSTGGTANVFGLDGTTDRTTLTAWKTAVGKDASSINANPGFSSTTTLTIDASSQNAWNVSGMGQPISNINVDFNNTSRSTTVAGGSTDLGAYNVTPLSTPPSATETGTLANNSTTTYTLPNGRVLGSIAWGAGGTVPTAVNFVFYPGTNPPGSSGFAVANGYWVITPTGGSGYTYAITLNYDDSQIGNVTPESNLRVLKSDDGGVSYTPFLSFTPNTTLNTITVTGLNSFSTFILGDNDAPLPVNLSSFSSSVNNRDVKLTWKTQSEMNNTGFDVERSSSVLNQWVKAGYVAGKGNSNSPVNYSFEDKKLDAGKYNYRLKQIDNNGNFEFFNLSNVVEVGIPTKFDLSQNYPNPFNPTTKIDFSLPLDSKVSIKLYDISGREVKTLVNDSRTAGYYTVQFNASDLSSGTYFYRIMTKSSASDFIMTKKMILVK